MTGASEPGRKRASVVAAGTWGGSEASLRVSADGSVVEFVCASGALPGRIPIDDAGSFGVSGTYAEGSGAPPRTAPREQLARYSGRVEGKAMQLTTTLPDGTVLGPMTLTLGNTAPIAKCLASPPRGRGAE